MKMMKYIFFCMLFSLFMISCTGDADNAGTAQGQNVASQAKAKNPPHGHPGHVHGAGEDHHGHDHSGHDHDHSGHNHGKGGETAKQVNQRSPEEVEAIKARYEAAKTEPLTAAQKQSAAEICKCMNDIPLLRKVVNSKDQAAFNKAAGPDAAKDVKALQDCHNTIMPKAIKNLGKDAGVYAFKARRQVNEDCLNGNSDLWLLIGKYLMNINTANDVPGTLKEGTH